MRKVTSIFVFFSAEAIFYSARSQAVPRPRKLRRSPCMFFLPNMHKLCAYSRHRRYSNRILYQQKTGEFSVFK